VQLEPDAPAPAPTGAPAEPPSGRIEHATGPADVVLRYDVGPDVGVSELGGVQFNPGPEFTLYGDGTVIFRLRDGSPPTDGPIVRGNPFTTVHLDDEQVQALLRFALGEGGLIAACERYEAVDTDVSEFHVITIRAGGLVKRVSLGGPSPVDRLAAQLQEFDAPTGTVTSVFAANRYWGSILDAASAIAIGLLPDPGDGIIPWPWPDIAPGDFVGRDEGGWIGDPRRVLAADEAAVLGLDDDGGVVAGVFLSAPDGATIYYFSMWPLLPDDPG
jgi:hypothetical protein